MIIVKASKDSEASKRPSQELLAAMGKYSEELVKAGVLIYALRIFFGRMFGWDRVRMRSEDSRLTRLSQRDRCDSEIAPGTPVGSFLLLYQFCREALSETRNATVHGFVCTALARTASGDRLYWGTYVIPVSWLTRPYLMVIAPFRRILYPAMLCRIRRAWLAAYGATA